MAAEEHREEAPARDMSQDELFEALRPVQDPDLGLSIVDMGLIYKAEMHKGQVDVEMTLTTPGCPYGPQIIQEVHYTLQNVCGTNDVNVQVVWDPPWSLDFLSDEVKLDMGLDW